MTKNTPKRFILVFRYQRIVGSSKNATFLQRIESIVNSSAIERADVERVEDDVDGSVRFVLTAYLYMDGLIDYAEMIDGRLVVLFDVTPPDPINNDRPKDVLPVYQINVDNPNDVSNSIPFDDDVKKNC